MLYQLFLTFSSDKKKIFSSHLNNYFEIKFIDFIADIPKVKISTEQQVYFGSATTLTSNIFSCPSPDGVEWQKSNDGKTYDSIYIRQSKYNGSNSKHESPLLVIPKVTFEDKLHYRLLVWNKIGEQYSNTVFLNVIGSM